MEKTNKYRNNEINSSRTTLKRHSSTYTLQFKYGCVISGYCNGSFQDSVD